MFAAPSSQDEEKTESCFWGTILPNYTSGSRNSTVCTQTGKTLTGASWLIKAISEDVTPFQRNMNCLHLFKTAAPRHQFPCVTDTVKRCHARGAQGQGNSGRPVPTADRVEGVKLPCAALGHPLEGALTLDFWFLGTGERLMRVTGGQNV